MLSMNIGCGLLSGSESQAVVVALNKIRIFALPRVDREGGIQLEEERLAGAVERVADAQFARRHRSEHVALRVFDDHQDGALDLGHLAVQRVQTEPVLRRAEHQSPRISFKNPTKNELVRPAVARCPRQIRQLFIQFNFKLFKLLLIKQVSIQANWQHHPIRQWHGVPSSGNDTKQTLNRFKWTRRLVKTASLEG